MSKYVDLATALLRIGRALGYDRDFDKPGRQQELFEAWDAALRKLATVISGSPELKAAAELAGVRTPNSNYRLTALSFAEWAEFLRSQASLGDAGATASKALHRYLMWQMGLKTAWRVLKKEAGDECIQVFSDGRPIEPHFFRDRAQNQEGMTHEGTTLRWTDMPMSPEKEGYLSAIVDRALDREPARWRVMEWKLAEVLAADVVRLERQQEARTTEPQSAQAIWTPSEPQLERIIALCAAEPRIWLARLVNELASLPRTHEGSVVGQRLADRVEAGYRQAIARTLFEASPSGEGRLAMMFGFAESWR